jgi:hypothetical protein
VSPAVTWLRRWGISLASFIGGLATLFVFRRELDHVRWIVGYLLLLWLLFAVMAQVRQTLEASDKTIHRLAVTAAEYTIQTLYHGVLLFLLPVYWASTTLGSRNVVFLILLVALAVLATFDPWYHAVVHPRPWVGYVFFLTATFGALGVALPLIGVPPNLALVLAAWIAVAALTPAVRRTWRCGWRLAAAIMTVLAFVAAGGAYAARAWIPPVPLSLARAVMAWDVEDFEPRDLVEEPVSSGELRRRALVAYTAIYAPAGLRQAVRHVWRHEGRVVNVIDLSPVRGGRREGFRTYSRKSAFPEAPEGRWSVDVETAAGQLIGRLRFRVVP